MYPSTGRGDRGNFKSPPNVPNIGPGRWNPNKQGESLGGRFVGANAQNSGAHTSSSSSNTNPSSFRNQNTADSVRGASSPHPHDSSRPSFTSGRNSHYSDESSRGRGGGDPGGRSGYAGRHSGRGQYSNSSKDGGHRDFHSSSNSYSKSYSNDLNTNRSTTYISMDGGGSSKSVHPRDHSSSTPSTPTHKISFQPPDPSINRTDGRHSSFSSNTRPTSHGGNPVADPVHTYPNKRFRPNTEWNHPPRSIEDNEVRSVRQLNFTKPPSKGRDIDSTTIPHGGASSSHHTVFPTPSHGVDGYKRKDPRIERGRYLPSTQPSFLRSTEGGTTRQKITFSTMGREIEEGEEEGEVTIYSQYMTVTTDTFTSGNSIMDASSRETQVEHHIQVETTQSKVDSLKVELGLEDKETIEAEPVPSPPLPIRPPSPLAGPPTGLSVALSRLVDLQSQMEYQYAKYLLLCKEHEICKIKVDVIKNLPIGIDAIRDDLERHSAAESGPIKVD